MFWYKNLFICYIIYDLLTHLLIMTWINNNLCTSRVKKTGSQNKVRIENLYK